MQKNSGDVDAKPIRVQLTPLSQYCDKSANILLNIAKDNLNVVTKTLEDFEKLEIKVKTLMETIPAKKYVPVRRNLNTYWIKLKDDQIYFKGEIQKILPKIRGGNKASEANLMELISNHTKSPMNFETSSLFLKGRNREIKAINFLIREFGIENDKNFKIVDYEEANDVEINTKNPTKNTRRK